MGMMEVLRKMAEKKAVKKEKFREAQEDMQIQKTIEERQKSANRRELEKYYKEEEERRIKEELDKIRKQKTKEMWKGNTLERGSSILRNDRPILKEKNIFRGKRGNNLMKDCLFFK